MDNPLRQKAKETPNFIPLYGSKENEIDQANHRIREKLERNDIKWILDEVGEMRLVDCEEWSVKRAKEIAEHREEERQRFNHRQRYPLNTQENTDG